MAEQKDSQESQQNGNGTVVQEATSTTEVKEPTKRSTRVDIWNKFRSTELRAPGSRKVFNRIPDFVDAEKASLLLAGTDEFKKAQNIKVNVDRAQDSFKLLAVNAGKNLYVAPPKESTALYTKLEVPQDLDDEAKLKILRDRKLTENRKDIDVEDKVKLDLVVIGTVAVARDGRFIGRGNGYVDLDLSLLIEIGAITPETVIATTVHDSQLFDTFPVEFFQKHDLSVDIIATPTQLIRVSKRLPRPAGLFWELLSERRLKVVPVLQKIKENEEKAGKIIVLKSEDTDIEGGRRRSSFRRRPSYLRRRKPRKNTENNENEENVTSRAPKSRRARRARNQRGRRPKSDGEQSGTEKEQRNHSQRRRRNTRDFCIKVSNISKSVRIKDLKAELRKRSCNPIYISWKGAYGKCYLHFMKRTEKQTEDEINDVLDSLKNLSLTLQQGESELTVDLNVELLRIEDEAANRIESVDTTAV